MQSPEPGWFKKQASGCIVFTIWVFMGLILVWAYQCNLLALLTKVTYEKPIDSTEDLVKSGKEVWIVDGWWHKMYLNTSENEWHVKASEKLIERDNKYAADDLLRVARDGEACRLTTEYLFYMKTRSKSIPKVYFGKEMIKPYFYGWSVQKESIWKEPINRHILLNHQSGLLIKSYNDLFSAPPASQQSDLKPLNMNHFLGPFFILLVMLVIASLVFFLEICCKN